MDRYVQKLATNFLEHPVWIDAAANIKEGASSQVQFSHVDGEWHLLRKDGKSLLREGPSPDPDFGFCFSPGSIDKIFAIDGSVGDFAVQLFDCITTDDPEIKVDIRVISPFTKLLTRGYVKLLLRGGPKVLQYAASHGIRTLSDLRRLLKEARSEDPVKVLREMEEK